MTNINVKINKNKIKNVAVWENTINSVENKLILFPELVNIMLENQTELLNEIKDSEWTKKETVIYFDGSEYKDISNKCEAIDFIQNSINKLNFLLDKRSKIYE